MQVALIRVPGSSGGFRYAFALAQQTAGLFKAQAVQIARRGQPGATPEGVIKKVAAFKRTLQLPAVPTFKPNAVSFWLVRNNCSDKFCM